jgi:hypothetical protein
MLPCGAGHAVARAEIVKHGMFKALIATPTRTALTIMVWLGLIVCLYSMVDDRLAQWDFNVYYSAARAFASGGNPYLPIRPHPTLHNDLIYQYPPLTLYLFQWTTLFSLASAKLVWMGLKLIALASLLWLWNKDFERLDVGWPIALIVALGFNSALLRDFVTGNISTFEQLGIWFGFGLLLRDRPYAAAVVLACVAQFKILPIAFLTLIPLSRPHDGWKPFIAGCAVFLGLLALNSVFCPGFTHDYLGLFSNSNLRMDDRGISNPSSLAFFRDTIDLTAYMPGLSYNQTAGTLAYIAYLAALILVLIRLAWSRRAKMRDADPRLILYFGCALFAIAMPRMKDYSYILMLIPTLFVVRDLQSRNLNPNYLLLAVGLMVCAQPQQSNVPGLTALVYMLQAYLPLFMAAAVMCYVLSALLRTRTTA